MKKTKQSKPTRADAEKVYWWCVAEYGRSTTNGGYPYLEFRKPDYYSGDAFGYFDEIEGTLFVNKEKNVTIIDLIDTVIHEWTHYLQPIRSHIRRMTKEGKEEKLFENNDPLEIEARKIARRDRSKCFKELYS